MSWANEEPCVSCKHYYDIEVLDGHDCCHNSLCPLCAQQCSDCEGYEEGAVPDGKVRGELY